MPSAESFDEVLEICHRNKGRCQSRLQPDGSFRVETWGARNERNDVFVEHMDYENRVERFVAFLNEINFAGRVEDRCNTRNQTKAQCSIQIKANIAPGSQEYEVYPYGTDPQLTNSLVKYLRNHGFGQIEVVETETNAVEAYPDLSPERIGRAQGFETPITNLSQLESQEISAFGGRIWVSPHLASADIIIDMAKGKTHDLTGLTGAKKNFYGAIPERRKWIQFHRKRSGNDVPHAALASYLSTTPDFSFIDLIKTVHGNERSYLSADPVRRDEEARELTINGNTLIYSENGILADEVMARMMGIPGGGPIEELSREQLNLPDPSQIRIIGDATPIPGFQQCSSRLRVTAKLQDQLPIPNSLVVWGMQRYSYPIREKTRRTGGGV